MILKIREASGRLGISPSLLYQLVAARKIAHYRLGTGRGGIRFTDGQIEEYLEHCRVEPDGPRPGSDVLHSESNPDRAAAPSRLKHLSVSR